MSVVLETWLVSYVFYYPVIMSLVWLFGGICFYVRRERHVSKEPPVLKRHPLVSVLIPAHNEEETIADAVHSIFSNRYDKSGSHRHQ